MQPQGIKTRNRSQDEPMAEIECGEIFSGIKFKGLIGGKSVKKGDYDEK